MRTTTTTWLGGLIAVTAMSVALSNTELDVTADALAADSDTMTITMECTEATQTAFVPDFTYTLTIAAGAVGTNVVDTTHSVDITALTGGVNGEVSGDITDETIVTDGETNTTLEFWHSGPEIKTSGLACTANNSSALATTAASTDANTNLAVSFVGPAVNFYAVTAKVDEAEANPLFGPTAPLIGASLADGATDADGYQNGEVTYGGAHYRIANKFTHLGVAVDNDPEDIVLKFTMD